MTTSQEFIINQICQMALKTFARTTSDSNPMLHFKSTPEEFKSNLGQLKQIVNIFSSDTSGCRDNKHEGNK